jgi:protein-S-isoprenylcysteine O-methyltransferase Ste14
LQSDYNAALHSMPRGPLRAVYCNLTLATAIYLQVAMLAAALGFTQIPWYPVARGRGAPVVAAGSFAYLRLTWLPALLLDVFLALNLGRLRLASGMAWTCAGLGLLLFALATALGFSAWRALGEMRGPPVTITAGQTLVTRGPYGLVRHPVYLASVLQTLGAGLALQNWILFAGALAAFAFWKRVADDEDRLLLQHFGQAFRDYRRKVPQFIPFTGA